MLDEQTTKLLDPAELVARRLQQLIGTNKRVRMYQFDLQTTNDTEETEGSSTRELTEK